MDVIGTTKGRGTTGVIKRRDFGGLPATHGAKKVHREPGSTASLASNRGSGRPKKRQEASRPLRQRTRHHPQPQGRPVDTDNNLLLVRGAVPGFNGASDGPADEQEIRGQWSVGQRSVIRGQRSLAEQPSAVS